MSEILFEPVRYAAQYLSQFFRDRASSGGASEVRMLRCLEQLTKFPALRHWINYQLGLIHASHGRFDEAIGYYEIALTQGRPRDINLYHHLGLAQFHSEQLQASEQSFCRAIELNPLAYWSYQGIGEVLMLRGRAVDAEKAFRRGIQLAPVNKWLHFHLIVCLARQERVVDALDSIVYAASVVPIEQGPLPIPFITNQLCLSLCSQTHIRALFSLFDQYPDIDENVIFFARQLSFLGQYQQATQLLQRNSFARWQHDFPQYSARKEDTNQQKPPAFLIIGHGKAGTTALYDYLCQHPQLASAALKEVCYWSQFFNAGETWYRAHFLPVPMASELITGEASPQYFTDPEAMKRIACERPDIKLILLLREPVSRAYSDYQMLVRFGEEQRSWEEVVEAELRSRTSCPIDPAEIDAEAYADDNLNTYLLRSATLPYLKQWLALFPRKQLLILQNSEMHRDTTAVIHQVFDFLDLPPFRLLSIAPVNKGHYPPMSAAIKQRLENWFQPHQTALAQFLVSEAGSDQ